MFFLFLLVPFVFPCGDVSLSSSRFLWRTGHLKSDTQRIIGGVKAADGAWPWQTLIKYIDYVDGNEYLCGGALISSRHILTAAHCVITMDISLSKIFLGSSTGQPEPGGAVLVRPVKKRIHPKYSGNEEVNWSQENDIAILTFLPAATFSDRIRPICLPGANFTLSDYGFVTGYGARDSRHFQGQRILGRVNCTYYRSGNVQYELLEYGGGFPINNSTQICAGAVGHGSAQGDSGGPLVQLGNDGKWFQVGIVSFGVNSGKGYYDQAMAPGIFTRVSAFCDFIRETARGEADCIEETKHCVGFRMEILILFILLAR